MSNTAEIAATFTELLEEGKFAEAAEAFWADDVVSVEPMGENAVTRGKEAVRAKMAWWNANHEVHGFDIEGPYVNGDQFALVMEIEVTVKATGMRMEMEEIALYTVRDGKIVEERFLYDID
jgi:ketosteroid isomerase-like protein